FPLVHLALLEPEQVPEARLYPRLLVRVGNVGFDGRPELVAGRGRVFALGDSGAHPHHLGERPVGDALAVREAPAAMPVDEVDEPCDVLLEPPRDPRLAHSADADDGDEMRPTLVCTGVEEILDQAQLALATDERRLEARRLQRPAAGGRDAEW